MTNGLINRAFRICNEGCRSIPGSVPNCGTPTLRRSISAPHLHRTALPEILWLWPNDEGLCVPSNGREVEHGSLLGVRSKTGDACCVKCPDTSRRVFRQYSTAPAHRRLYGVLYCISIPLAHFFDMTSPLNHQDPELELAVRFAHLYIAPRPSGS